MKFRVQCLQFRGEGSGFKGFGFGAYTRCVEGSAMHRSCCVTHLTWLLLNPKPQTLDYRP